MSSTVPARRELPFQLLSTRRTGPSRLRSIGLLRNRIAQLASSGKVAIFYNPQFWLKDSARIGHGFVSEIVCNSRFVKSASDQSDTSDVSSENSIFIRRARERDSD